MALPLNLTTNEVKNSAGTEVEFLHFTLADRRKVYAVSGETPSSPHRITVQHDETGSGLKRVVRSNVSTVKTVTSDVDNVTKVQIKCSTTVLKPAGYLASRTEITNVVAEHVSFIASQGATTTILYDGTGYGAACLINESL